MIIERSADFGRTWRPNRYFASNCTKTFPRIPASGLHNINDIICEERYSDIEPSTDGEVRSSKRYKEQEDRYHQPSRPILWLSASKLNRVNIKIYCGLL